MNAASGLLASEKPTKALHFAVDTIRQDFPILNQLVHAKPLAYLDNAATSQKRRRKDQPGLCRLR